MKMSSDGQTDLRYYAISHVILYNTHPVYCKKRKNEIKLHLLPSSMYTVVNLSGLDFHGKFIEASRASMYDYKYAI